MVHLLHASGAQEDTEFIRWVRERDVRRDWNEIGDRRSEKNSGETEMARFNYYDGKNPDWPMKILSAEYEEAVKTFEEIRNDDRTTHDIITTNKMPHTPVLTKGLTQVTSGAPQSTYNGGLLRSTVRYFDQDRGRPGLPPDIGALVDELGPSNAGIQLVNTSRNESRRVIVQAGAFGEHQFTEIKYRQNGDRGIAAMPVNQKYFSVELPPSTSVRIDAAIQRFANTPSYAFPWHGKRIPVPFQ
jgi:hypothetical protein